MEKYFEDGGEFYYRKRKEDDDDDYANSSKKSCNRRDLFRKPNFTKPLGFVSAGTVMPDQDINNSKKQNDDREFGSATSGFDLGFSSGPSINVDGENEIDKVEVNDDDSFLPKVFGKKTKEGAQNRERLKLQNKTQGHFGGFENHTKGIGKRLLYKAGYKGGGIGKNEQGIVNPIEVQLRPKNMGIGFSDYKETQKLSALKELEEMQNKAKAKEKLWSKRARPKAKKETYTTAAEELLAKKQEEEEAGVEVFVEKVFDMRGPHVRILTNLENLNAEEEAREQDVPIPELQYNVKLISDMTEHSIQKMDSTIERETTISLKNEERLETEAGSEKEQEIRTVLDRVGEENSEGTLTLDSLAKYFDDLQKRYREDYKLRNLSCIAYSFALPLFIRMFQGWDPLLNPLYGVEVVSSWKALLHGGECLDIWDLTSSSPYGQLLFEVVVPAVRISGINTWQLMDPEPMIRFLESWENLLPPSILDTILDDVVMPKLKKAVDSWEPHRQTHRETFPINAWIQPWLHLLGHKLEYVYQTIRFKLGNILGAWHPSESLALTILKPWKDVFDSASWEQLMRRFIVPKLQLVMQEFHINPADQKLDQFDWVIHWFPLVPFHFMVDVMDKLFFTKWLQVLYHWLCSNPNFEEVRRWYLGWKELFPEEELLSNLKIRSYLYRSLEMMDQAVSGRALVQPDLKENQFEGLQKAAPHVQHWWQERLGARPKFDGLHGGHEMSLKEVIEFHAQQHGLLFKPKPGRMHYGKQIYGYGNISIILDSLNDKAYARTDKVWSLASLELLLDMHNSYHTRRS